MESENRNLSANEEEVPPRPDLDSLLSQIDKLETELEIERKKNAEQTNKMKYLQADLINFQRQAERMVSDAKNQVKLNWILKIISIKEDLDRALDNSGENSVLVDGLKLLTARIENDLKAETVEQIQASIGTEFDPKYHDAVAFQETDKKPEGCILSVIGNGYTIGGKVIKPALVEIARKPQSASKNEKPPVNDSLEE